MAHSTPPDNFKAQFFTSDEHAQVLPAMLDMPHAIEDGQTVLLSSGVWEDTPNRYVSYRTLNSNEVVAMQLQIMTGSREPHDHPAIGMDSDDRDSVAKARRQPGVGDVLTITELATMLSHMTITSPQGVHNGVAFRKDGGRYTLLHLQLLPSSYKLTTAAAQVSSPDTQVAELPVQQTVGSPYSHAAVVNISQVSKISPIEDTWADGPSLESPASDLDPNEDTWADAPPLEDSPSAQAALLTDLILEDTWSDGPPLEDSPSAQATLLTSPASDLDLNEDTWADALPLEDSPSALAGLFTSRASDLDLVLEDTWSDGPPLEDSSQTPADLATMIDQRETTSKIVDNRTALQNECCPFCNQAIRLPTELAYERDELFKSWRIVNLPGMEEPEVLQDAYMEWLAVYQPE
ncbi:hypothetical protein EV127DRAFT_469759 [Xylaria flabelliformis]|nr:hypothetical protein EV127DRAFT_469759 [Xylaria flabelliformis]